MVRALKLRPVATVGIAAAVLTILSLAGIHWIVTVLALGATALLALMQPAWVVAAAVLSVPVQSEVMLPFVRGELTLTQLMLFGLIVGWGIIFWRRRIWLDSIVVGFLLVLAAYAVSFIAVDEPSLWFQESYRWAVAGIFYVICRSVIHGWQDIRPILWSMLAGVLGVSIMSAMQVIGEAGPGHFLVGGAVRVYASFGTPNTLAAYLEMTVPVLLACIPIAWILKGDYHFSRIEKYSLVIVPGIGLITLLLTQSRGGLIGILAACGVLWLLLPTKAKLVSGLAGVVMFGGFMLTTPGQSQISRFAELTEESSRDAYEETRSSYVEGAGRGALWSTARIMISENPLTGIGAGEFDENYREYVPSWLDRFPRGQAHNVWLQMGAQAGIWGILGYAAWFAASVWSVITARRRIDDRQRYWLLTGVLAVFVAYTLHSMVDYLNVLSLGLQLSVLTAIALNLAPDPLTRYERTPPMKKFVSAPGVTPCPE